MIKNIFLEACVVLAFGSSFFAHACGPSVDARCQGPKELTVGTDGPAPLETRGYSINHFALISNDLNATRKFYGNILGMRHVFTYDASDRFSLMYMSYAHGGKNGTGFMSGCELYTEKANLDGLIEFIHVKGDTPVPATEKVINTFSHVGLIVPDTRVAQERVKSFGVRILKAVGEVPDFKGPLANPFGIQDPEVASAALAGISKIGFNEFLIIADPDGNVIEVQPRT